MKNKKIGLDLDGVLYPFAEIAHKVLKERHGFEWGLKDFWARELQVKYYEPEIKAIAQDSNTYCIEEIDPYIPVVLNQLVAMGNTIYYITARGKKHREVTEWWLTESGVPFIENLHLGKHHKAPIAKELGLDVFVDDRDFVVRQVGKVTLALRYYSKYMTEEAWRESEHGISSLGELIGMKL